jgi:hypothetical protein
MIFRWLLRRREQKKMKRLALPEAYDRLVASGHWNWISEISEWRAFRQLFFPMSIVREADPKQLRELQKMIEQALQDSERKKDEKNTMA